MLDLVGAKTKKFVDNTIAQFFAVEKEAAADIERLSTLFKQYSEAANDYIAARKQYLEYLEKYEATPQPVQATIFTGINASQPSYSSEEMVLDSETMQKLGEMIKEMYAQLNFLENQLMAAVRSISKDTRNLVMLTNQSSSYLDQLITSMESPYDIAGVGMHD
jgi:hypothetical protein